jgi:NADH dehydrogenase (ubiquinone) 1 beta subcomplex subunit 8
VEARDPYYPYDMPEHKRNFNEPIHANIDLIGEDRYGSAEPLRFSIKYQLACFLGVMSFCWAIYLWLEDKKMFRPVLPKQLPAAGKPHYTFEPAQ